MSRVIAPFSFHKYYLISPLQHPLQLRQTLCNLSFEFVKLRQNLRGRRILYGLILGLLVLVDGQVISIFYDLVSEYDKNLGLYQTRDQIQAWGQQHLRDGMLISTSSHPDRIMFSYYNYIMRSNNEVWKKEEHAAVHLLRNILEPFMAGEEGEERQRAAECQDAVRILSGPHGVFRVFLGSTHSLIRSLLTSASGFSILIF